MAEKYVKIAILKQKGGFLKKKTAFYLVAGLGFEPKTFGLCLPLQLSLLPQTEFVVWTFPSPFPTSRD